MSSVLGRNVFFSCEHFAMSVDDLMGEKYRVHDICLHRRTATDYCRAICIFKLLMLGRGLLLVPGMVFTARAMLALQALYYVQQFRLSVCPSVCLSVCLSVTRRYCVKTTARRTAQFAPLDSKMCLVL